MIHEHLMMKESSSMTTFVKLIASDVLLLGDLLCLVSGLAAQGGVYWAWNSCQGGVKDAQNHI